MINFPTFECDGCRKRIDTSKQDVVTCKTCKRHFCSTPCTKGHYERTACPSDEYSMINPGWVRNLFTQKKKIDLPEEASQ